MNINTPLVRWLMILETIRSVTGEAFLAGGCLRDSDNDRPVKDVDIFVPEGANMLGIQIALEEDFDFASIEHETDFTSCDGMKDVLHSVNFVVGLDRVQVNVIVLEGQPTMAYVLERMDFGLCQIGYDGKEFMKTKAYVEDRLAQTLTLTRKDNEESYSRSLKRFGRLSEKYQGWALVDSFAEPVGPVEVTMSDHPA